MAGLSQNKMLIGVSRSHFQNPPGASRVSSAAESRAKSPSDARAGGLRTTVLDAGLTAENHLPFAPVFINTYSRSVLPRLFFLLRTPN